MALKQRHTSCSWRSWGTLIPTNNLMTTAAMLTSVIKIMQEPCSQHPQHHTNLFIKESYRDNSSTWPHNTHTHTHTQIDAGQRAPGVHFNVPPIRVDRHRGHRREWSRPWTHTFKIAHSSLAQMPWPLPVLLLLSLERIKTLIDATIIQGLTCSRACVPVQKDFISSNVHPLRTLRLGEERRQSPETLL